MDTPELAAKIRAASYLEGDFVLRSGKRSKYYLDKYLFETRPDILAELGRRLGELAGDAEVIAGAELGAVALAAAASMACGKPFAIVRKKAKDYATGKTIEGTAARLLMFTSINWVSRFLGANSSRKMAAKIPIGMATMPVTSIVSSDPTIAANDPASSG